MEQNSGENQVSPGGGILRQFDQPQPEEAGWGKAFLISGLVLLLMGLGTVTGYFLSRSSSSSASTIIKANGEKEIVASANEVGVKDDEAFPDSAQGKIEVNDFSEVDEGSHRLLRVGGKSQTAYLTSSVVDLDQFVGQCVQIQGKTHAAQKAGWLIDIGYLKVMSKCPEGL